MFNIRWAENIHDNKFQQLVLFHKVAQVKNQRLKYKDVTVTNIFWRN